MFPIKVHLDPAELAVIRRYANSLEVSTEDVAYAALDRLMQNPFDPEVQTAIKETRNWRSQNLPTWADTERSVHAYEGGHDDQPEEHLHF